MNDHRYCGIDTEFLGNLILEYADAAVVFTNADNSTTGGKEAASELARIEQILLDEFDINIVFLPEDLR